MGRHYVYIVPVALLRSYPIATFTIRVAACSVRQAYLRAWLALPWVQWCDFTIPKE
jgi:hypothetical protein